MKNEYLIVGSNNFWYAICLSKKEALKQAKEIMNDKDEVNYNYGNEEMTGDTAPYKPETLYIYKAVGVAMLENEDEDE